MAIVFFWVAVGWLMFLSIGVCLNIVNIVLQWFLNVGFRVERGVAPVVFAVLTFVQFSSKLDDKVKDLMSNIQPCLIFILWENPCHVIYYCHTNFSWMKLELLIYRVRSKSQTLNLKTKYIILEDKIAFRGLTSSYSFQMACSF